MKGQQSWWLLLLCLSCDIMGGQFTLCLSEGWRVRGKVVVVHLVVLWAVDSHCTCIGIGRTKKEEEISPAKTIQSVTEVIH